MSPSTSHSRNDSDRALTPAAQAAVARWEKQRAQGRSSFIWRNGVVGWGFPAALLTAAYKVFQEQGMEWTLAFSGDLQRALMLIAVVFPTLGYFFGSWLWTQRESRYQRMLDVERRRREVREMTRGSVQLPPEQSPSAAKRSTDEIERKSHR